MGIKGLTKEIKKIAPSAIQIMSYQDLINTNPAGHKVYGVDVYSYLYPTQYNAANKGKGNHIREFMEMITTWASYGARLIFVFDGNTNSDAKRATVDERVDRRIKGQANVQRLIHEILETENLHPTVPAIATAIATATPTATSIDTDLNKLGHRIMTSNRGSAEQRIELEIALRSHIIVSIDKINDLITLFKLVGATYIQAKGEADFLLASLYKNGYVDGVISEDCDMLTHGVGRLVRGITDPSLRHSGRVSVYCLSQILNEAEMSMNQFIDYCILCGCDYCPKIAGVAGAVGLRLLKKHSNINNIISCIQKGDIKYRPADDIGTDDYLFQYERAFRIFSREQEELPSFHITKYIIVDEFRDWIMSETNYAKVTLESKIKILQSMPEPEIGRLPSIQASTPLVQKTKAKIKANAKLKSAS
jgi:5'-3' exonuclease